MKQLIRDIHVIVSFVMLFSLLLFSYDNTAYAQCKAITGSIPDPLSGCGPLTVVLNSDSSTGTITGYSWDFGDGSAPESVPNPTHNFAAVTSDTSYTITLSITCSTAPSSDDTSITVTVYAPPPVLFFIDTAAVCNFSDTVCFDNKSETGVGFTYDWDFGDSVTCGPSCFKPCHSYTLDGTYTVELKVTDDNFCQDSLTLLVNTNFSLLPVVTLGSSAANDTICIGDSITFTASPGGYLIQPVNYVFYNDTVIVQSGTGNTFGTTALADSDSITVILINASGCVSDTSNTVATTVLALPNVSLTSSDTILCEGDSLTFTATPAGLNNYLFYDGTTLLQSSASDTYLTDSLNIGNVVFVNGVSVQGCISPPSNSLSITVKPTPAPYITSNIIDTAICRGDSATLTAEDTTISGAAYVWNTAETTNSITVGPFSTTTYSVTATLGGCTDTNSNILTVDSVLPTANAGIDTSLCEGKSAVLNASGGTFYSWSPSTGLSCTSCQSPLANPVSTVTYQLTVTNIACFDTDDIIVTIAPCLIGTIPQVVTPNQDGANDIFKIPGIDNFPDNKINIFNSWGNIVFNADGYDNVTVFWDGKSNKGVDLPDGTYYYLLDLGNGNEPQTGYVTIYR